MDKIFADDSSCRHGATCFLGFGDTALRYLCAYTTAIRPVTETARERKENKLITGNV